MSTPPEANEPNKVIARQLFLGFGSVSTVTVLMSVVLLGIIYNVSGLVRGMRHSESSIRQGLELATAVREQGIHVAYCLVEGSDSHLGQYEEWRLQIRSRIQKLAPKVPPDERWRLEELGGTTQRIHELFLHSALPAAQRGDLIEARRVYRRIEPLGRQAAEHADILARSMESQMARSHDLATDSTRLGLLAGGLGALLVVLLSVGFALRLRWAVIKPLITLTDAARRLGRGEFGLRVGDLGEGELATLGHAFDHMTEELERRQARLVHSERMTVTGQLAAGVAHELNNPIAIIRGYLKTMTPEDDPKTLREELAILDEEAAQCQRIAEDLLAYSRSGELNLEPFPVEAFLKETAARYRSSSTKSLSIEVEAQAATIDADRTRLRQVVLNLLLNAGQASPENAKVTLRGVLESQSYRIEVLDEGPGIAPGERQKVFEPFYSKSSDGTGLGLSVVQGIVRAHGGHVEICDVAPQGTRFVLIIPLQHPGPESEAPTKK